MEHFENLVNNIETYKQQQDKEAKEIDNFLFKPLNLGNKGTGFLVYSKETIKETKIKDSNETLFEKHETIYKSCKDYKNIEKCNELNTYRYYYYCKIDYDNKKHATIIMMNPAFACSENMDPTISNIYEFLKRKNFTSFDIINLFPVRMPNADSLYDFINDLDLNKYNDKYKVFLKTILGQDQSQKVIIAAWGNKYHSKAKEIFKNNHDIKFKCFHKNNSGAPTHFGTRGFQSKYLNVDLESY